MASCLQTVKTSTPIFLILPNMQKVLCNVYLVRGRVFKYLYLVFYISKHIGNFCKSYSELRIHFTMSKSIVSFCCICQQMRFYNYDCYLVHSHQRHIN